MQGNTYPVTATAPASGPAWLTLVPSPLTRLNPGLAEESAEFFVLAGWTPADLATFSGDRAFTAEVQAAMRRIGTLAAPEASCRPARCLRVVPGGER